MNWNERPNRLVLAALALSLLTAACAAEPAPHEIVDADLEPLRTAFNADVDRVRAILLGAPT